ncbi:hypothetical protein [Chitinophaga rhizophila]|uniref:RteC protein n=1 Tax=Chitinophaga rhizophila TaxID=2866212 RepID=A0ABS7G7Y1_9BACT|nr:hypothetical protein [Chitinophaga rhizophila]MBW8682904.1 hypothetical protein [Chitinophaga rhizophila]
MQKDYILEMIEELGRALRAVISMKKTEPFKALESIRTVFTATKFKSKEQFDQLTVNDLEAYIKEKEIGLQTLDTVTDLLFEEADMLMDAGNYEPLGRLTAKLDFLLAYLSKRENELKIVSLKRGGQRNRLQFLLEGLR